MIFIGGIADGIRRLAYGKKLYCRFCGRETEIEVYMTYFYFSFFFIPLFKWNKRFFVVFPCCGRQCDLKQEKGLAILRGEDVEITEWDLGEPSAARRCPGCGAKIEGGFRYCPNCGEKL